MTFRPMTRLAAFDANDAAWKTARLSALSTSSYPEQAIMRRSADLLA